MRKGVLGLLSLLVFVLALLAVNKVLGELAWADVRREIALLSPLSMLLALAAAFSSYALLTVFDLIAVRYGDHKIPLVSVAVTAFIANALGHNLGMAAITGGSVRAHAYADHGLDAVAIGQIIANASLGFLLGAMFWLGVGLCLEPAFAALTLPAPAGVLRVCGVLLLLALALSFIPLVRGKRRFQMFGKAVAIPGWRDGLIMLLASMMELGCAAGALYALLPDAPGTHFLGFTSLYVIAITAGVVSTVPGGLGVFEAALLLMLPSVPPPVLLGSILVYRAIYYLLPLALALLLLGLRSTRRTTPPA